MNIDHQIIPNNLKIGILNLPRKLFLNLNGRRYVKRNNLETIESRHLRRLDRCPRYLG